MKAAVAVVILNWNRYAQTSVCLRTLRQSRDYPRLVIYLVDNASEDRSGQRLKSEFPEVKLLVNERNLGFARGVNVGLRAALADGMDFFMLLNSDLAVGPDFLSGALHILESDPTVGIVTGKILQRQPAGMIWHAGGIIDHSRVMGIPRGMGQMDIGQYEETCETGWGSGAMCLFSRATVEKAGLIPEEYFFGQEEWDFSTRVRQLGLKIIYCASFGGVHDQGGSHADGHPVLRVYNANLNKMIYARKYLPRGEFRWFRFRYFVYLCTLWPLRAKYGCRTFRDFQARYRAAWLAFFDFDGITSVDLDTLARAQSRIGESDSWKASWRVAD